MQVMASKVHYLIKSPHGDPKLCMKTEGEKIIYKGVSLDNDYSLVLVLKLMDTLFVPIFPSVSLSMWLLRD